MDVSTTVPRIVPVDTVRDVRGTLSFIESPKLPFTVHRLYYFYDFPNGESVERGKHGHIRLETMMLCVAGTFRVHVRHKEVDYDFLLDQPNQALHIPPMSWRRVYDFAPGSVGIVLASRKYEREDYIFEYEEFLKIEAENRRA